MGHRAWVAVLWGVLGACAGNEASVRDGGAEVDASPNCGPGSLECSGRCVNFGGDPQNCGGCGVRCTASQYCFEASCLAIDSGMNLGANCGGTLCSGRCVHLQSDPRNCGYCGRQCEGAQRCVEGACLDDAGAASATDASDASSSDTG